jgi:hypothetical protein
MKVAIFQIHNNNDYEYYELKPSSDEGFVEVTDEEYNLLVRYLPKRNILVSYKEPEEVAFTIQAALKKAQQEEAKAIKAKEEYERKNAERLERKKQKDIEKAKALLAKLEKE